VKEHEEKRLSNFFLHLLRASAHHALSAVASPPKGW